MSLATVQVQEKPLNDSDIGRLRLENHALREREAQFESKKTKMAVVIVVAVLGLFAVLMIEIWQLSSMDAQQNDHKNALLIADKTAKSECSSRLFESSNKLKAAVSLQSADVKQQQGEMNVLVVKHDSALKGMKNQHELTVQVMKKQHELTVQDMKSQLAQKDSQCESNILEQKNLHEAAKFSWSNKINQQLTGCQTEKNQMRKNYETDLQKKRDEIMQLKTDNSVMALSKERAVQEKERLEVANQLSQLFHQQKLQKQQMNIKATADVGERLGLQDTTRQPRLALPAVEKLLPDTGALNTWVNLEKFEYSDTEAECFSCYLRPVSSFGQAGTYFGQVDPITQLRQGRGVFVEKGNSIYEGYWAKGAHSGQGRVINKKGEVFTGTFSKGNYVDGEGTGPWVAKKGGEDGYQWTYTGTWKNGKPHGRGGIGTQYQDDRYNGTWVDGKRSGQGNWTDREKVTYRGGFKNDLRDGKGIETQKKGKEKSYVGSWKKDEKDGYGTRTWKNGTVYEAYSKSFWNDEGKVIQRYFGQWANNAANGYGVMKNIDKWNRVKTEERGNFKDGKNSGFTNIYTIEWSNQYKLYEGQMVNGFKDGEGIEYTAKGVILYKGLFKNGKRHGEGVSFLKGKKSYVGLWKDGLKTGKGTIWLDNKERFIGNFVDGQKDGQGTLYFTGYNTVEYEGTWKNNKKNGEGKLHMKIGSSETYISYNGTFVNDLFEGEGWLWKRQGGYVYSPNRQWENRVLPVKVGLWKAGKPDGFFTTYKIGKDSDRNQYYYKESECLYENGKRNGKCKIYGESEKLTFDGICLNGFKSVGKLYSNKGELEYEGTFHQIAYNAKNEGTQYKSGKKTYTGTFVRNNRGGQGTLFHRDGIAVAYKGGWFENKYHGKGLLLNQDGSKQYEGQFHRGLYDGSGTLYKKNGSVSRKGEWKQGKPI